MRTTVTIRRGALLAAAAMACAAAGPPTQAFDLMALAREALPRALVASAYPFDPWETPVHYPNPGDLAVPPAPPPPPGISAPPGSDPANPIGTGTGALPGSDLGIPVNVLAAYMAAADKMTQRAPECGLTWEMLAGIGRVESHHAAGGNLRGDGTTVTPIIGPALTGGGFATQTDTDHGRYDHDTRWDHAVGPMQFLPGTWRNYGVDGNADGVKDPNNVYDSTLAAAQYLCAGGTNLAVEGNLRAAIYAYNPSTSYVETVLSWIRAYQRSGGIPVLPTPTTTFPPPIPSNPTPPSTSSSSSGSSSTQRPADHKAPSTPANLRVVRHTGTTVALAWGAAKDNVAVTGYEVFRDGKRIATISGTKLTVNGLAADRTYTFRVRARDAAGNHSALSAPATVLTDVTPPSVPGGLEIVQQNRDSLQLRWTAAADNVDSSPTYLLFVRDPSGAVVDGARVTLDGTTAAVAGLSSGTPYTVELFAIDSNGNRSSAAAATIPADREAPTTPAGLAGVASPPASGDPAATWSVQLAWLPASDDVEVTDYVVSYAKAGGQPSTLSVPAEDCTADQATGNVTCAATVSGLDADGDYTFTLVAKDAAGHSSPASEPITVTTAASAGGLAGGGSPDPTSAPTDIPSTGATEWTMTSTPSGTSSSTSSSTTTSDTSSSGSGTSSSTTSSDPAPSSGSTSSTDSTSSTTTSTPSTSDSTTSTSDSTSSTPDATSSTTDATSSTTDSTSSTTDTTTSTTDTTTSTTDATTSTSTSTEPSTDPSAEATTTSSPTP